MRALVRSLAPTQLGDVAALVALYRPGPMAANMHNDYADRKNGRKPITYLHPDMADVLSDTYGLMIYQESMLRVAQRFAGYTLVEAENLRKAAGKKVREIMAKEREKFVAGCERTGYGAVIGSAMFDIIEPFADYAFGKSHAFGYGLVAYWTAWLKANHPVEYMACLLTSVKDDKDKMAVYFERVPVHGHRGPRARHQPLGLGLHRRPGRGTRARARAPGRRPLRAVGHPQRGRGPGRAHRRRAGGGRPVQGLLRLLQPGRPGRAQQAHGRVAGQGGCFRLAGPPPPGPVPGVRAGAGPHSGPAPRGRPGRAQPVRRPSGGGEVFDDTRVPVPDKEFDKHTKLVVRERDAGAVRERPPPGRGGSGLATPHRLHHPRPARGGRDREVGGRRGNGAGANGAPAVVRGLAAGEERRALGGRRGNRPLPPVHRDGAS